MNFLMTYKEVLDLFIQSLGVLATFGAGHLNKQIRILEHAFGKPTFVDTKA